MKYLKHIVIALYLLASVHGLFFQPANHTEEILGASTSPVAGTTYNLAGSGITASATSITLQSLTVPQTGYELTDADFSDRFYITLEPGNSKKQEIAACTTVVQNANNTATVSGCDRGMLPYSPFTASSTYAFSHGGGTTVIFSDAPQFFNEYTAKANIETITAPWSFTSSAIAFSFLPTTTSTLPTLSTQVANKAYVDSVATAGGATSTEAVSGISKLATQAQMASSTWDPLNPTVVPSRWMTSTPGGTGYVGVVTGADGKINQEFLRLAQAFTWTGSHTHNNWMNIATSSDFRLGGTSFTGSMALLNEGTTFFNLTDITGTEAETLTNGSNADLLHTHNASRLLATSTADTGGTLIAAGSTTTIYSVSIPANTLGTGNVVRIELPVTFSFGANASDLHMGVDYGGTQVVSTTFTADASYNNLTNFNGEIKVNLMAAGTTSSQEGSLIAHMARNGFINDGDTSSAAAMGGAGFGTATQDSTGTRTLVIWARQVSGSNSTLTVQHASVEVLK